MVHHWLVTSAAERSRRYGTRRAAKNEARGRLDRGELEANMREPDGTWWRATTIDTPLGRGTRWEKVR